jgi:hypothetical protein
MKSLNQELAGGAAPKGAVVFVENGIILYICRMILKPNNYVTNRMAGY